MYFKYRGIASYRRATKTGQTTLEQAKTTLLTRRILSQARLRYTHVEFIGTANRRFRKTLTGYTHLPFCT